MTGGEPTLQKDLLELCKRVQKIGKYISIDTNGSNLDVIKEITPFINRVAMDLKGPLNKDKYEKIAGVKVELNRIFKTIEFLNSQNEIDFEIRTTYVAKLLDCNDIDEIINFLDKMGFIGNYVIQQYQFLEGVGEEYKKVFSKPEHDVLVDLIEPYKDGDFSFKIFLRDDVVGYQNIKDL
ncbi:MAG: radical SAM protein [Candidatus Hodarchaeota archaeon]